MGLAGPPPAQSNETSNRLEREQSGHCWPLSGSPQPPPPPVLPAQHYQTSYCLIATCRVAEIVNISQQLHPTALSLARSEVVVTGHCSTTGAGVELVAPPIRETLTAHYRSRHWEVRTITSDDNIRCYLLSYNVKCTNYINHCCIDYITVG